jgi:RNA polymerase sigma-70 factor (ECF subfamily)
MFSSWIQWEPLGHDVERLIREARGGSSAALGHLMEGFRLLLLAEANQQLPPYLRRKAGPSDLVEDTLLEALQGFVGFKGCCEPELKTWLCTILDHNVHNFIRKFDTERRAVKREVSIDDSKASGGLRGVLAADEPSPSTLAGLKEEAELLCRAMERLSAEEKTIIRLRHNEQQEYPAIGKEMGISEDAARKRFTRAIEALQKRVEQIQQEQKTQKLTQSQESEAGHDA